MSKKFLWKYLLPILALTVVIVFVYQDGYLDYARRDQILYMKERAYIPKTESWFMHSVNLNRTRLTYSGDYFLFRPGLHFCIAVEDIYLRDEQLITGVLSIAVHLMVTILLYLLLMKYLPDSGGFLWAALFASQYPGIEMILWRHISPYMLTMVFVFLGFWAVFRKKHLTYTGATFCFLMAMLFHEVVPAACFLYASLFVFLKTKKVELSWESQKLFSASGIALSFYLISDAINWVLTKPGSFLGSSDHLPLNWDLIHSAGQNFFLYLGAGLRSVLGSLGMSLFLNKGDGWTFEFNILEGNVGYYYLWGLAGMAIIVISGGIAIRRIIAHRPRPSDFISLWMGCGLLALTFIFSFFRMTFRTPQYCNSATYYYWFFSLFFIILLKYLMDEYLNKPALIKWKKVLTICIYMVLIMMILGQAWLGREAIKNNYNIQGAKALAQAIHKGKEYFASNPACLDPHGEIIHSSVLGLGTLPSYLHQYNCDTDSKKTMVHVTRNPDGTVEFEPGPF